MMPHDNALLNMLWKASTALAALGGGVLMLGLAALAIAVSVEKLTGVIARLATSLSHFQPRTFVLLFIAAASMATYFIVLSMRF